MTTKDYVYYGLLIYNGKKYSWLNAGKSKSMITARKNLLALVKAYESDESVVMGCIREGETIHSRILESITPLWLAVWTKYKVRQYIRIPYRDKPIEVVADVLSSGKIKNQREL